MADPRRKGARGEREWAAYLRGLGLEARRVPLSGAAPGYGGDVESYLPDGGRVLWQVKRRGRLPGWLSLEEVDAVALREDRGGWYVLMPAELWARLVGLGRR
jgi:Holliday junction resolvase